MELADRQLREVPRFRYILNYTLPDESEIKKPDSTAMASNQSESTQVMYDAEWRETNNSVDAKYFRVGIRDSLGRWQGQVRDYYINGDLQMRGRYTDNLRDGIFIYYSDHRTYASAGRYARERAVGRWKTYHWNGEPESEMYREPQYFMNTVWDSLGQKQVSGGNGEYKKWYANGNLRERGNYVQGKREGFWFGYHENGKPYYKEQYSNNRLISGASENLDGKRFVYDQLSELPFPVIGVNAYRSYIEKSRREFPSTSKQGVVKVIFTVGKDGELWDFTILEGLTPEQNQEAIRLIKDGPTWRPAFLHGDTKIQSEGYMEIKF